MADSGGINAIIVKAVTLLFSDSLYKPRLSNCWLPAVTWAEVLTKSGHIDPAILQSIDARKFNTAMSKSSLFGESMTHFNGTNQCGMFRVSFQRQFYYYYAHKTRQVAYPVPLTNAWKEKVLEVAANVLVIPSTRARPEVTASPPISGATTTADNVGMTLDEPEVDSVDPDSSDTLEESPCKRQRLHEMSAY